MSSWPLQASSTMAGSSERPFTPPKALPRHTRPVTNWNGLVEISCPDAATPYKTATHAANSTQKHSERDLPQCKAQPADLPQAAGHSLCAWSNDDGALAPALVAALESGAHQIHIAFEIEKLKNQRTGIKQRPM
jgi:hypothetical protein